jgi:hypothetical protein
MKGSRGSSVSIVSDCVLDDRAIEVRFPAQARDFSCDLSYSIRVLWDCFTFDEMEDEIYERCARIEMVKTVSNILRLKPEMNSCHTFQKTCQKTGEVYSLAYTDIQKVFFTLQLVGRCYTDLIRGHFCALGYFCITTGGPKPRPPRRNSDTSQDMKVVYSYWSIEPWPYRLGTPANNWTTWYGRAHKVFSIYTRAWKTRKMVDVKVLSETGASKSSL